MIVAAAIKMDYFIWTLPPPESSKHIIEFTTTRQTRITGIVEGFVNENTTFLNTSEAAIRQCGPLKGGLSLPVLFREDFW
jgi:hypothetical protein